MSQLNNLTPLVKKRKRIGRGGSRGGTSGRGHKGQKARSGGTSVRRGFEGGQMPLSRRLPKRGFNNKRFEVTYHIVNISLLEELFSDGDTVTKETLREKGIIKGKSRLLLKVLGNGELTKKLIVSADAVSASAKKAIEGRGGELHLNKEI